MTARHNSDGEFSRVSAKLWQFAPQIDSEKKEKLLRAPAYPEIVREIIRTGDLIFHRRERCKACPFYYRLIATLQCVSSDPIVQFHSASSGYRAQYYLAPTLGEDANRFAVAKIGKALMEILASGAKRTCASPWLEKSIGDSEAKVWIHQGAWLRAPRASDKLLRVTRWNKSLAAEKVTRKRARYAELIPWTETRIDFKGGFVTLSGKPLGSLKPNRAETIHKQGFT